MSKVLSNILALSAILCIGAGGMAYYYHIYLPRQREHRQLQTIERQGLPIGFSCVAKDWTADLDARSLRTMLAQCWSETKARSGTAWVLKALGWLITALAVSLGGPFWFELLNRLVDMRGAGKKPPSVTTAAAAQR